MKKLFQMSLLFWLVLSATAQGSQKVLHVYDWKDLKVQQLPSCKIISMDGMSVLKIENTNDAPLEISLLNVKDSIIKKAATISLEMKYENVRSKLVERTNPMGFGAYQIVVPNTLTFSMHNPPKAFGGDEITNNSVFLIDGTANWNPHRFTIDNLPDQLELNLHLMRSGTIYIRPIKLLAAFNSFSGWWSPEQAGLIGGIGVSIIGCFGGLLGLLAGKGKARNFVLTTMKIFIVLGILLTIAGFVGVASNQPYAVWYALLLPGAILILVFSLTMPSIQRRYDELEIRRMTSLDV